MTEDGESTCLPAAKRLRGILGKSFFDVSRAVVLLPFQIYRLQMLVEADMVAFSSACFEFADAIPEEAQHASLANLPKVFPGFFMVFQRLLLWDSARRYLLASSLSCYAAFISASTPGPAHQPCAPRGCLEHAQFGRSGKH